MRILHVGYLFRPFHFGGLLAYAEGLMDAQVARGDEVHYFFSGRHYPLVGSRVRRWERRGVRMHELVNSPVVPGPVESGTRRPDLEVDEPTVERALARVIADVRPDVVHVQELSGLPSSVLELPHRHGVPVLMTLQDYTPVCPTTKLFDADERTCRRLDPAPQCVRCCRDAPSRANLVNGTLGAHRRQIARRFPIVMAVPGPRTVKRHVRALLPGDGEGEANGAPLIEPEHRAPAEMVDAFRRRRDVNVARLSGVDRLVPMSERVAEIYAGLGVDPARMRTMQLTLPHIDGLRPRRLDAVDGPVHFVTLNGCATPAKGAYVVADALDRLAADGLTAEHLTFSIAGHPSHHVIDRLRASPFVRFLGNYPASRLGEVLERFHVGVVPSVWEEAFGYVGIEMLAKGLPVLANDIGGMPEYTKDGETGWLNHACDGEGLARIMAAIVADPSQVVERNHTLCERRDEIAPTMEQHVDDMYRAYEELIAQSSSTSVPSG